MGVQIISYKNAYKDFKQTILAYRGLRKSCKIVLQAAHMRLFNISNNAGISAF